MAPVSAGQYLRVDAGVDSPPPCGEGIGVGGTPTSHVLRSPPPCPSPTRGEGTPTRPPSSPSAR
jgi:tRNA pseudouridine32 synthase/23S rRNA pseudouridine746 synthase